MKKYCLILFLCQLFIGIIGKAQGKDSMLLKSVDSILSKLKSEKAIGFSMYDLYNSKPDSKLGDFFSDAIKYEIEQDTKARIDVVIFPTNNLRGFLPKGNISVEEILRIHPFEDTLVRTNISGEMLKKILDKIAQKGGGSVSGIQCKIENMSAEKIVIGEDTLVINYMYSIVISKNSFIYKELYQQFDFEILNYDVNQLVIKYIVYYTKLGKAILFPFGKRISY